MCSRPFRPLGLPIHVARRPAAPFTRLSLPRRKMTSQLEEWAFDCEKQNHRSSIDSNLDPKKSGHGRERDVVVCAELFDEMDSDFLNQVRAIRDAGDESGARNCNPTEK